MRSNGGKAQEDGSGQTLLLDLTGVSVFIGMPTTRGLPPQAVISLIRATHACWKNGIKCEVLIEPGISDVCLARSICAHRFLHQSEASVLFWIDSDMQFSADAFMRTLALTTKVDAVCGSYSDKGDPPNFMLNAEGPFRWNEYGCIANIESGPMGFSAIRREVIEVLASKSPASKLMRGNLKDEPIRQIFHRGVTDDGYELSEDVMFFRDIRDLDFEIWCDPSLVLGHIGDKVYEGALDGTFDRMREIAREEDVSQGGQEVDEVSNAGYRSGL